VATRLPTIGRRRRRRALVTLINDSRRQLAFASELRRRFGTKPKNKKIKKYYFKTFEIILGKLYRYLQHAKFIRLPSKFFLLNIL